MTTATRARESLGLTPEQAARRLRITPRYLRSIERNGNAPYALAERLSRLYNVPMHTFLYRNHST